MRTRFNKAVRQSLFATAVLAFLMSLVFTPLVSAEGLAESGSQGEQSDGQSGVGTITGVVFQDWDQDGERDAEEPLLAEAVITLYDMQGTEIARQLTTLDCPYSFAGIESGDYILVEQDPLGYSSLKKNKIIVSVSANEIVEANFGDVLLLGIPGDEPTPELNPGRSLFSF